MEQLFEYSNKVLVNAIESLPEKERHLIVGIFSSGTTLWRYCREKQMKRSAFLEMQQSALGKLNRWLTDHRVNSLRDIL
jgi:hypothetical protein